MSYLPTITPHGHLNYPIDELSIGVESVGVRQYSLAVFARGRASIGYDLDGSWRIDGIRIDGFPTLNDGAPPPRRPPEIKIAPDHPLYALIHDALIDVEGRRIDDRVFDRVAAEREDGQWIS